VRRVALRRTEAAEALGVSADFFAEHVAPELKWIHRGRLQFVGVRELERWVDENGARVLDP
jgi:hypothetical protein